MLNARQRRRLMRAFLRTMQTLESESVEYHGVRLPSDREFEFAMYGTA